MADIKGFTRARVAEHRPGGKSHRQKSHGRKKGAGAGRSWITVKVEDIKAEAAAMPGNHGGPTESSKVEQGVMREAAGLAKLQDREDHVVIRKGHGEGQRKFSIKGEADHVVITDFDARGMKDLPNMHNHPTKGNIMTAGDVSSMVGANVSSAHVVYHDKNANETRVFSVYRKGKNWPKFEKFDRVFEKESSGVLDDWGLDHLPSRVSTEWHNETMLRTFRKLGVPYQFRKLK